MSKGLEVKWVRSDWLLDHLNDHITVVDCQPNMHDYFRGHIPRAVYLNEESLRLSQGGTPPIWLDDSMASAVLSNIGVIREKPVIVYGRAASGHPLGDGVPPLMVAYSLVRYGHDQVHVPDGGFDSWLLEGMEFETRYPSIVRSRFVARTRTDLWIDYEGFLSMKDRPFTMHIDSRSPNQYAGSFSLPKRGHIPGALNIPWFEAFEASNLCKLRDDSHMHKTLNELGVHKYREIICHCGSGRRAASQLCILKWLLGYPKVRFFEGSFTEWCSHTDNPTVVGSNPD